jgi:DNA repair exonuclease SbcCD ATPase subunit
MRESILRFRDLNFEGAGLFKHPVHIELEKRGLVAIIGDEGAGKSTIPEVITTTIWGQGSPRVRTEVFTDKSIANAETGYTSTVNFVSGFDAQQRDISITQSYKHPSMKNKYGISINGDDSHCPTTKPEQKKLLQRVVPLSQAEWLGVGYLHQGGIHSLLSGTKSAKRDYLTAVFGLSFWEDLILSAKEQQKMFAGVGSQHLKLASELATLEEEAVAIAAAVAEEPDPEELRQQVDTLTERLQTFAARVARLSALTVAAKEHQAAKDRLAQTWGGEEDPSDARVRITEELKTAKASLKEARAEFESRVQAATHRDSVVVALKTAKKQARLAEEELSRLSSVECPTNEYLDCASALLTTATQLGIVPMEGDTTGLPSTEVLEERVRAVRATYDRLDKLSQKLGADCACPTCGADLHDVEDLLAQSRSELAEAKSGLARRLWEAGATLTAAEVRKYKQHLAALSEADRRSKDLLSALKKQQAVVDALPQTSAQDVEDQRAVVDHMQQEIEAALHQRSLADEAIQLQATLASHEKTMAGVDAASLQADLAKAKEKHAKAQAIHQQAMAAKERVDQATARLQAIAKQRVSLNGKISDIAHMVKMTDVYDKEVIPYLSTLRSVRVRERVSVLENVLPAYVKEMSTSQYEGSSVKLSVSDDLEDIDLVLRPSKYNNEVSPVQASGGQRRRFTLALLGALREVSPRTTNIMFFDEPLADLQSEGKLLFLNRLLPLMLERCPGLESIMVIAHDREVLDSSNTSFNEVWKVTNHGSSGSKVTTGLNLSKV